MSECRQCWKCALFTPWSRYRKGPGRCKITDDQVKGEDTCTEFITRKQRVKKATEESELQKAMADVVTLRGKLSALKAVWGKYHSENCGCNECSDCNIADCAFREVGMAFYELC